MNTPQFEHIAAQEMAQIAKSQGGVTIQERFSALYEIRFLTRGHTDSESIQREMDITPALMERAQKILDKWLAEDRAVFVSKEQMR